MNDSRDSSAAAARWFARMHDDRRTAADEAAFNRWLAQEPGHERAYRHLESLWSQVEGLRSTPPIQALRVDTLRDAQRLSRGLGRWPVRLGGWRGIAASLLLVLAAAAVWYGLPAERSYQTAVGDRRTIELSDGTELTLNTDSAVQVHYSLSRRDLTLLRGQAHFKVAASRLRPFSVDTGQGVIRALGTEFDVYRRDGAVQVVLIEGRIKVSPSLAVMPAAQAAAARNAIPVQLIAGQKLALTMRGASAVEPANVASATAWLDGKLIFNNERLAEAVAEVNRYSAVKLAVADATLADLRVSGVFRNDRADTFLEAVRSTLPVKVSATASGLVIGPRE